MGAAASRPHRADLEEGWEADARPDCAAFLEGWEFSCTAHNSICRHPAMSQQLAAHVAILVIKRGEVMKYLPSIMQALIHGCHSLAATPCGP
jgi:hypothetical protein